MTRMLSCAAVLAVAASLLGQTAPATAPSTAPATRPSTVGKIAASANDVVPLGKGAAVPKVTLKGIDGKPFDLNDSIAKKPTVLIFYRGGWCPYCNQQMSGLEGITKPLTDAGYQLLAISPDKPEELAKSIEKHTLTYTLLSDSDVTAIKAFGLAFKAAETQFSLLEQYSGEKTHALPVPAVYILGTDGTIKFVHYDPDFKKRMDPAKILEEAKAALPPKP